MDRSRPRRCTGWSRIDCGSMRRMYASLAIPRTPQLSLPMRGSAGQRTPRSDVSDFEGGQRAEMNSELAVVLVLLAAAIAMFAINKPRMDAVALIMLTALPFTGVMSMGEALAGFSETRLLVLLMAAVATLGSFMSSTGVVAIFIPVVLRIAQSTGLAPSRLMMPLSVAALISGMMTLVATAPNLVVNSQLVRYGMVDGFHFFSFTPFGVPVLILGIIYMLFARRWLTAKHRQSADSARRPSLHDWIEQYKLADREYRLRVTERSPLVG